LLCIISFNNFKSLATLNSADTKKFLDQVLGFYTLTEYAEACKELRSDNLNNIRTVQNEITRLESQIHKLQEISNIDVIEGDINEVREIIKKYDSDIRELNAHIDSLSKEYSHKKTKLIKEQSSLVSLGKNKKKEIDFIEKGTCPTCGAPIDQSQLEIKKQEREVLLSKYNEVTESLKVVEREEQASKQRLNQSINDIRVALDAEKKHLHQLEEQAKRISVTDNEIENIRKSVATQEAELVKCQSEDAEWIMLQDILTSQVRSKILSSFIPTLNNNISKYSVRLQLPYNIEFDSNFKCNISLSGIDKEIPISSLSTGQLKTVDMVIILGVLGTVIGSNGINVLFLDELFSNLDVDRRNEMCCVLRETLKSDSTIFIISHMDMEDKYFDGTLSLKLENRDGFEKHSIISIKKFDRDL
jgi:DNA repair exonuclease SbcCD ATPase subunit